VTFSEMTMGAPVVAMILPESGAKATSSRPRYCPHLIMDKVDRAVKREKERRGRKVDTSRERRF
jgi:hypothetical protein